MMSFKKKKEEDASKRLRLQEGDLKVLSIRGREGKKRKKFLPLSPAGHERKGEKIQEPVSLGLPSDHEKKKVERTLHPDAVEEEKKKRGRLRLLISFNKKKEEIGVPPAPVEGKGRAEKKLFSLWRKEERKKVKKRGLFL